MAWSVENFVQQLIAEEHPEINLSNGPLSIDHLELALMALKARGEVKICNCGSVPNMIEMGAYLANIGKETTPR
jgi:hypothetical protein